MRGALWSRAGRRRGSRGTAALEVAMVMPVFLGVIGISITMALAGLVKFQLKDATEYAVRYCAASLGTIKDRSTVGGCIARRLQNDKPNVFQICTVQGPYLQGPGLSRATLPPTYLVGATLVCNFGAGSRLENALPGGAQLFTISATSVASFLPRYAP